MTVHNHPPYRPTCNERMVDGQLRGACLSDDGSDPAAPTPADVPGQGEVALSGNERDWLRTAMELDLDLNANDDHLFAAVERMIAARIAAAEQRGREDNADHGMCYVSGSKALAERDAEVARGALRAAAERIRSASDRSCQTYPGHLDALAILRDLATVTRA